MIRSEKKLQNLALVFKKEDNLLISQAIELLREEPPFEGAIALLSSYYNKTEDRSVRKSIEGFMNDLKDQSASSEVMNEILKQHKNNTISMLVSSCWQSGLDYSEYSKDLAEIFMKGDSTTAIECLTVIGESIHELTREAKDEIIEMINKNSLSQTDEKRLLVAEMKSLLNT